MIFHSRLVTPSLLLLLGAGAVNPATGRRELMLVSEAQELAMGKEYDQQLVAEMGLYNDSALANYVQRLGARLAALSERPQLPWAFRLVDDPVINAFAVPGG
jgi:predicted Zn-dependent protease